MLGGAFITQRVRPGVLYQDHGARADVVVSGLGGLDRGGANNLICTDKTTSKNCAGEVTNSFLVGIEKVDVFELAAKYPEAFSRKYDPETGILIDAFIEDGE